MSSLNVDEIRTGLRFLFGLPPFLHHRLSTAQARCILQKRFENRGPEFLDLVRQAVYHNSRSPYRQLLDWAGCEFGDLEQLVIKDGIENALRVLFRNGVYLSLDEFKGRRPVVRGAKVMESAAGAVRNPLSHPGWSAQTGGSSGRATTVAFGLNFVRDRAVNLRLFLESRGGMPWRHAIWGVPGSTDLVMLLELAGVGLHPLAWFSQVRPDASGLHPRYRWSARILHWSSLLAGKPLPLPADAPLNDPRPLLRWVRNVLDAGQTPHLTTFVTPAIRLCQRAQAEGIDITGTQMTLGGEPMTPARLKMLQRSGVAAVPRFLAIECGYIGYGCLKPEASDDNHLIHDFNTVIQAGPEGQNCGFPAKAMLVTNLRRTVPMILLNVCLGDEADLVRRPCGCPLEKLGYETHISLIRSYQRLKSGGMTFLDRDVVPILEETLPGRFGGTALDYQLEEREREDGTPEVLIVINPSVGPLDPEAVVRVFLEAIGRGSGAERIMGLQWRGGNTIRVEHRVPEKTATGKIKHLLKSRSR